MVWWNWVIESWEDYSIVIWVKGWIKIKFEWLFEGFVWFLFNVLGWVSFVVIVLWLVLVFFLVYIWSVNIEDILKLVDYKKSGFIIVGVFLIGVVCICRYKLKFVIIFFLFYEFRYEIFYVCIGCWKVSRWICYLILI